MEAKKVQDITWKKSHLTKSQHTEPVVSTARQLFSLYSTKAGYKFTLQESAHHILVDAFGTLLPNSAFKKMYKKEPSKSRLETAAKPPLIPPSPMKVAKSMLHNPESDSSLVTDVQKFL